MTKKSPNEHSGHEGGGGAGAPPDAASTWFVRGAAPVRPSRSTATAPPSAAPSASAPPSAAPSAAAARALEVRGHAEQHH
jgi:hypothetical protein